MREMGQGRMALSSVSKTPLSLLQLWPATLRLVY